MEEYIAWDYTTPGISFSIVSGRITIFKTTLVAIGYPEYYRFLFSPEDMIFGIEPCGIDDGGAHILPKEIPRDHYSIKGMDLVKFVYRTCGWKKKVTYRIPGARKDADSHTVYFDLRQALEVHEGRVQRPEL